MILRPWRCDQVSLRNIPETHHQQEGWGRSTRIRKFNRIPTNSTRLNPTHPLIPTDPGRDHLCLLATEQVDLDFVLTTMRNLNPPFHPSQPNSTLPSSTQLNHTQLNPTQPKPSPPNPTLSSPQTLDGTTFVYPQLKQVGLYFVLTTMRNISPSFALELLHRLTRLFKDYCGTLNEESIRKNFVLIYELLDEILV